MRVSQRHHLDRRDRGGGALVVVTVSLVMMAITVVAIGQVGGRLVARQRAQNAADAVALAAVSGGDGAAHTMAERYGATVESLDIGTGEATVTVSVGGERARARANNRP